mgnify:CR=1 FL=1
MDIKKIKQLREETGLGMLEVKEALQKANDDLNEARKILKELSSPQKTSVRVASKGMTNLVIKDDQAILFEVNAETDFVVKNPAFTNMVEMIGNALIESQAITVKDALNVTLDGEKIEEIILKTGTIIKENTYLRRFHRIRKQPSQGFGSYIHQQGKLSILVILHHTDPILGKDLAMHIASYAPTYLSIDAIDKETVAYERFMLEKNQGPVSDDVLMDHLKTISLYEQPFIKNPDLLIRELVNDNPVIDFYRFELGQGIENKLNCRLDIPCDGSKISVTPLYGKE